MTYPFEVLLTIFTSNLILQKRIVRLLTFNDNYPVPACPLVITTPLFYDLKILIFHDIFKVQTAKFVYKCLHNLNPPHLNIMFIYVPGIYNTAATRNRELLIPLARTTRYGLNSITKVTTKCFTNALSISSITCYKNE